MTAPDRSVLGAHLRRLDPEALAALIADLWAARGFEVSREGTRIEARRGETPRTVEVLDTGAVSSPAVDVTVRGEGSAPATSRTLDAEGLGQMLLYAVERPVADEIAAEHLGAPLGELRPPPAERLRRRLGGAASLRPNGSGWPLGVAAVLVALAGLWLVALLAPVANPAAPGGAGGEPAGEGGLAAPTPAAVPTANGSASTLPPFPPGVGPDNVTDVTALADAHETAAANTSYTVWVDQIRPASDDSGAERIRRDIDVATEGEVYRVAVDEVTVGTDQRRPVGRLYHDGTRSYAIAWDERNGSYGEVSVLDLDRVVAPSPGRISETLVLWYLSSPETDVTRIERDGRPRYRITARGQPTAPPLGIVHNYTATAVVDRRGFVRELSAEYEDGYPRRHTVRHEVTYGFLGETEVETPAWYERWRANRSAD